MSDAVAAAWATEGLGWLFLAVAVAGVVRGFSGFGTALVYVPVAATVLPPVWTLITLVMIDLIGPLPHLPRALRDGHRRDMLRLGLGAVVALPFGVLALSQLPEAPFRWAVSLLALALLLPLVAGWRYRGVLSPAMVTGVGVLGGGLAGSTGLAGPPVIMLYMASTHGPAAIRANLILYLLLVDVLMMTVFGLNGMLSAVPLAIGGLLLPVYLLANLAGAAIFRPERERTYRAAAYVIIAGSALSGLPLFD